jgi:hypothetical protein
MVKKVSKDEVPKLVKSGKFVFAINTETGRVVMWKVAMDGLLTNSTAKMQTVELIYFDKGTVCRGTFSDFWKKLDSISEIAEFVDKRFVECTNMHVVNVNYDPLLKSVYETHEVPLLADGWYVV